MSPARKNLFKYIQKYQSGQGVIEIVVVLALAAILILSLVALSVRSNRSANFSKAEDQAARLSQEGMETIRSLRDQSLDIQDNSSAVVGWDWVFDQNFSVDESAGFCGERCLDFSLSGDSITLDGRIFNRTITVRDNPDPTNNSCNISGTDWTDIKQFTVEVTWEDTSGSHTSASNSCLRRSK